jgi:hypothetical protein
VPPFLQAPHVSHLVPLEPYLQMHELPALLTVPKFWQVKGGGPLGTIMSA